jgi:hypothetical protein
VPYGQRQQHERLLARHSCSRSALALPNRLATLAPSRPVARVPTAEAQSVKSLSPLGLGARRQMMSGHHSWPPHRRALLTVVSFLCSALTRDKHDVYLDLEESCYSTSTMSTSTWTPQGVLLSQPQIHDHRLDNRTGQTDNNQHSAQQLYDFVICRLICLIYLVKNMFYMIL